MSYRRSWFHRCIGSLITAVLVAGLHATPVAAASSTQRQCRAQQISVSMFEGAPVDQAVHVELCTPAGAPPPVVQLLLHGITYDHHYFDQPGFNGRYSYAASANGAGYATLTVDRLGSGSSSHPPAALIGANSDAWVAHQLVQKLRAGEIESSAGPTSFRRVVEVGHSYGTGVTWLEASRYQDVDAVIATGGDHFLRYDTIAQVLVPSFVPAPLDKNNPAGTLDPGSITTRPGTRYADFMAPGKVDPDLVNQDERLKQTVTATELAQIPLIIGTPLDIRVPTLVALGDQDTLFCGAGINCDNTEQLVRAEAPKLGPAVPCVEGHLQPGGGHDNVLMHNAPDFFTALNSWTTRHAPPSGASSQC